MEISMIEVALTVGFGSLWAFLVYIVRRMNTDRAQAIERAEGLRNDLGNALANMVNAFDFEIPNMDSIKEVIEDSIQGIMGTFQQPTGGDMIMGAISQMIMSKVQKGPQNAIGSILENVLPDPILPQNEEI